jgi:DNA-directed RNA polymerase subunit H (RpoH/RPB5)
MSQSNHIVSVYNSRRYILELLARQGYNTNNDENFGINEIHIMMQNKQQDMILEKPDGKKAYIKYHLAKPLRNTYLYEYIEDLFELEKLLTKKDDLIIITKDEPNDSINKIITNIWETENIFIIIFPMKRLQYNILKHDYVPPHKVLDHNEMEEIKKKYNIKHEKQFPEISRFDPVAQAISLRPGELCEIIRPSKTAITSKFYRICSS